jgi:polyphosphate kinase 2 (PPK2 family)
MPKKQRAANKKDVSTSQEKLKNKDYLRELRTLHIELVRLQEWVKSSGAKICIVFEGRDGAGKGGTIKAITERVSPRTFRVIALPAPPSARNRRCISSAIFLTSQRRARS